MAGSPCTTTSCVITSYSIHYTKLYEHVEGNIQPLRDIETINFELIFSDLEIIERRLAKSGKGMKNEAMQKEFQLLERLKKHLEDGKLARSIEINDEDEEEILASFNLLTSKPVIFAANVKEDDLADDGKSNAYA